jgi:hypothetical protein
MLHSGIVDMALVVTGFALRRCTRSCENKKSCERAS